MSESLEDRLQTRVSEFVKLIDEGDLVQDRGTESMVTGLNQQTFLLDENDQLHTFDLEMLREFAKFLVDMMLKSHATVVSLDNHLYWGWTAAYMYDKKHENHDFRNILDDFNSMVHLNLLPHRQSLLDDRVNRFINSMNPSIRGVSTAGSSLAATAGFSVLEGFIVRNCKELNERGELTGDPIEDPSWRSTPVESPSYYDMLQIWKEREASSEVAQALSEINDLSRYPVEDLTRKMAGASETLERHNDFLSIFSDQRHYNIHGELSTQVVGPIVMNLCCLALWDSISPDSFSSNREDVLESIEFHRQTGNLQRSSGFYPLIP